MRPELRSPPDPLGLTVHVNLSWEMLANFAYCRRLWTIRPAPAPLQAGPPAQPPNRVQFCSAQLSTSSERVPTNWPAIMSHHGECDIDPKSGSHSLAAEHMTLDQAAELMGVTSRHTRRILAAYREHGAAALAHGHRGRRPVNATPEALVVDVAHLARTRYAGVTVLPPPLTGAKNGRVWCKNCHHPVWRKVMPNEKVLNALSYDILKEAEIEVRAEEKNKLWHNV